MIKFIYNNKLYYADNLPKKLKRLKITEDDITILGDFEFVRKDKHLESEYEDYTFIYVLDKTNNHTYLFLTDDLTNKPNIYELLKNYIWNDETKTGVRNIDYKYIGKNMELLNGKPKYPIEFDNFGNVILEIEYNWK